MSASKNPPFNANAFQHFLDKMDYEGGLYDVMVYGYSEDKGDAILNKLFDKAYKAMEKVEDRMTELRREHADELLFEWEEEDDDED